MYCLTAGEAISIYEIEQLSHIQVSSLLHLNQCFQHLPKALVPKVALFKTTEKYGLDIPDPISQTDSLMSHCNISIFSDKTSTISYGAAYFIC